MNPKLSYFVVPATDVVTVYVFHEPSLLSSLQDGGLTAVVLKSLVVKDVSKCIHQDQSKKSKHFSFLFFPMKFNCGFSGQDWLHFLRL